MGLAVGWGFECLDGVQGLELRIRGICLVMGMIGGVVFASSWCGGWCRGWLRGRI